MVLIRRLGSQILMTNSVTEDELEGIGRTTPKPSIFC